MINAGYSESSLPGKANGDLIESDRNNEEKHLQSISKPHLLLAQSYCEKSLIFLMMDTPCVDHCR